MDDLETEVLNFLLNEMMVKTGQNMNYGLKVSDALSKSLEIANKDADRYPELKAELYHPATICYMAELYGKFEPETMLKRLQLIESNPQRLKKELKFLVKTVLFILNQDPIQDNQFDRWDNLLEKYRCHAGDEAAFTYYLCLIFVDSVCDFLIKNPNISKIRVKPGASFDNFKQEHTNEEYFAMLPAGTKYGGFVKAIFDYLLFYQVQSQSCYKRRMLSVFRFVYHSSTISQEERLAFFEKLNLKEDDLKLWSITFDLKYPEYTYIHKLFGQTS